MSVLKTVVVVALASSLSGCVYSQKHLSSDFGYAVRQAAVAQITNPDAVYYLARIDGAGTYRIVGERGNAVVAGFATGNKMFGLHDEWGKGFNNYDVDHESGKLPANAQYSKFGR